MKTWIKETLSEVYVLSIVFAPYFVTALVYLFALIGILSLASCKKDEPQTSTPPQCDCYEVHQIFVQGLGWQNDYNTDTTKMNCNSETYTWTYTNAEQTKRKSINCL